MSDTVNPKDEELAKSMGIAVQPPPIDTGGESAHDILNKYIEDIGFVTPPVDFKNIDFGIKNLGIMFLQSYYESRGLDIKEEVNKRKEFGLKKYGTPLTVDNGRDHIEDAAQELIDFLVYYVCWENEEKN